MIVSELVAKLGTLPPHAAVVVDANWGPSELRKLYTNPDRDMVMFSPFPMNDLVEV